MASRLKKKHPTSRTDAEREAMLQSVRFGHAQQNFLDDVVSGLADLSDVDDYVEMWHNDVAPAWGQLWDWLGMTPEEYSSWVEDPHALEDLFENRRRLRERYGLVRLCDNCHQRPATTPWSSGMPLHGAEQAWCSHCALSTQLEYARKQAARIPGLEQQLAALDDD